jgi:uncharacterized membrane protein
VKPEPVTTGRRWTIEERLSRVIVAGVGMSIGVCVLGAADFLRSHRHDVRNYSVFTPEAQELKGLAVSWYAAIGGDSRAMMQVGLWLLILTPVARVLAAAILFSMRKERVFVIASLAVLAMMCIGLSGLIN